MAYSQNRIDSDLECDSTSVPTLRDNIVEMDRKFRKLDLQSTSFDSAYSSSHSATSLSSFDTDDKTSVSSYSELKSELTCIPETEDDDCLDFSVSKDSSHLLSHQNDEGDSLLHLAIIRESLQIAEDYIHGVRAMDSMYLLNLQNNFFQTPLHLAVITKQLQIVEILLKCNVAVDIPDYYGNTALHIACREGNIDIAQIMFQYASNHLMLDLRNYDGLTCLHIAALQKHYRMIELLLSKGANINVQDGKSGRTVLHYAAEHGNATLVNLLFNYSQLDINATTYSGMSALYLAEGRNHIEIKQMLQLNGAAITDYSSDESEEETSIADDFCINGQPI